jgi:two-component system sensor histidine kinase/response regulator
MPAMNGLMLTREIRSREALRELNLIMLTSDRDRDEAAEARAMGVGSFLVKPVRQAALFKAIAQMFGDSCHFQQPAPVADQCKLRGWVLVAEDNATNQKVIVMQLTRLGCMVEVANDGLEAVQLASHKTYDLILMDCQMPVMDGFQATRAIRQHSGGRVPIVALTANAMEGERQRCLDAGMDDYLAKPVRPDDLIAKLRGWLGAETAPERAAQFPQTVSHLRDQLDAFIDQLRDAQTSSADIDSLLSLAMETTPPVLLRLAESIRRQEEQPACFAAHSLKGSFGSIGLPDLAHAVAIVEEDCKGRLWQKAESDMEPVVRLFEEVKELVHRPVSS